MPLSKDARYRVVTTKTGKKVRLAWGHGEVVEAKSLSSGKVHTKAEFATDRKKARKRKRSLPWSSQHKKGR